MGEDYFVQVVRGRWERRFELSCELFLWAIYRLLDESFSSALVLFDLFVALTVIRVHFQIRQGHHSSYVLPITIISLIFTMLLIGKP